MESTTNIEMKELVPVDEQQPGPSGIQKGKGYSDESMNLLGDNDDQVGRVQKRARFDTSQNRIHRISRHFVQNNYGRCSGSAIKNTMFAISLFIFPIIISVIVLVSLGSKFNEDVVPIIGSVNCIGTFLCGVYVYLWMLGKPLFDNKVKEVSLESLGNKSEPSMMSSDF